MNDTQNYEKTVKVKTEGKLLLAKAALIIAYVLFAAIGWILVFLLADGHPALILLVALLDFCLWLLTNKRVKLEYEYAFTAGNFYLAKIMGKSSRKELFEEEISRAVLIAPYNDKYMPEIEKHDIKKTYNAISSKKASDVWFILFEGEGGQGSLVLFEADERSLKCLRQGAPRAMCREKLAISNFAMEDTDNA